jgi:hypothetical protein
MNRTNYIFIDFENVQETDLERISNKPVQVTLILGERHKNLPIKLVRLIQKYPTQIRLVETVLNGKNALDFVLAYEIGIASEKDPNGYFHILSKDKGFDALIKHLKAKEVRAARHTAVSEISVLMNAAERVKYLGFFLTTNSANRPKKRKTLESQIHAMFGKTLLPEEVEQAIQGLIAGKIITLTDKDQVSYKI